MVWLPPPRGGKPATTYHRIYDEPGLAADSLAGHGRAAPPLKTFTADRIAARYHLDEHDAQAVAALPSWWIGRVA
jgi:hypothetical protein